MQTVEDESGRRYLLEQRSHDTSRVRDPETGERRFLRNERLSVVEGESSLEEAATQVPSSVRRLLTAVHDDRGLGLLITIKRRKSASVRSLLDETDLCESDLHGRLGELRAAGLLEETSSMGERGYAITEMGDEALAIIRGDTGQD